MQYQYDTVNRIAQMQDADGRTTTSGYDLMGNLTRPSDSVSGDLLMSYDRVDRLVEVVSPQGTVDYTYDAIGRRTSRTVTGGDVTGYTYDRANRIKAVTLRGKTATYNYDVAGRLISKVLPDGIQVAYGYDNANRVTSIAYAKADATPIETLSYAYDPAGQRVSKALGSSSVQETGFNAAYDAANRLTSITLKGESFTLSYDANGNLVSKSGPVSGTTTYTWDARSRLTQIAGPGLTASFRYDASGRRIERTVNGVTTGYLYDGVQAIAELRGSAVDTVYHTGVAIDEVLARYAPSGNKTLLTDALNSVIAQAGDDQSVQNFYNYSPYGETTTLGLDDGNSLQYTGRESDNTGLYFYRARYYDPVLKRFIAEDPIGIAGGLNFYAFVHGKPTILRDPSGLDFQFGASISGTLFGPPTGNLALGSIGLSGGTGFGISTDGTLGGTSIYGQVQANGLVGAGVFGGVGVQGNFGNSDGPMTSGTTVSPYFEANAGAGGGAGVSGNLDPNGRLSGGSGSVRGFPGTGLGVMAGGGVSTTTTWVSPTLSQIWNNLRDWAQQPQQRFPCP